MLQHAATLAETQAAALRKSALKEMNQLLGHEVRRLENLQQVNDHVRPQEIELAQAQQNELATAIGQSRLRLDSLRLIWHGPTEVLG
jgi:ATP-dependent helicase HepA